MSEETSKRALDAENQSGQSSAEEPFIATEENQKKWSQLVTRAWADENLKQRLLNDPMPLLREQGIEIPAGVEAHVTQDKNIISCMLQPPPQPVLEEQTLEELTLNELSGVVGGTDKKPKQQSAPKLEFLTVTLNQVLISSF